MCSAEHEEYSAVTTVTTLLVRMGHQPGIDAVMTDPAGQSLQRIKSLSQTRLKCWRGEGKKERPHT